MPEEGAANPGLLGWRNWTMPTPFFKGIHTVPREGGGKYDNDPNAPNRPEKWDFFRSDDPLLYPERSIAWDLQTRFVSPVFKNFFTDMSAISNNAQGKACEDFELNAMECIEYYGVKQGIDACKDWYDDYLECVNQGKQHLRWKRMHHVRNSQHYLEYLQGKRSKEDLYEPAPKMHAFIEPWIDEKYQHGLNGSMV